MITLIENLTRAVGYVKTHFTRTAAYVVSEPVNIAMLGTLDTGGGDIRALIRRGGGVLTSAAAARGAGALTLHFADGAVDARHVAFERAPRTARNRFPRAFEPREQHGQLRHDELAGHRRRRRDAVAAPTARRLTVLFDPPCSGSYS